MIDTTEAGGGSYPEPDMNEKTISGTILVSFSFEDTVPRNWNRERIEEHIRSNVGNYIYDLETIEEIDFLEEE